MCDKNLCHCIECFNYEGAPNVPSSANAEAADGRKRRKNEKKA